MAELSLNASERRRSLTAVITCMTLVGITIGLTFPLLSLILEGRGYSRTLIGFNAAMPAIAMLILSPVLPRVIGAIGLKPFLIGCAVIEGALIVGLKAFDNLPAWFALRFLMGATTGGLFVAGETWINQIADDGSRGRLMAVYSIALGAGFALGPIILAVTGTGGWAPFVAGAVCNLAGVVPLMLIGNLAPRLDGRSSFGAWAFIRIAPSLTMAVFAFAVIEAAVNALLPVYGVRTGYSEHEAALMLTTVVIGGVVLQWPVGWLADHYDRYTLIGILGVLSTIGVALLPFVIAAPVLLYAALFAWGGAASGIYTVALVILGERFRGPDLVTANAAFGLIWGFAVMVGPASAGIAMDAWDPHGLPAMLTAVCALFVVTVVIRGRSRKRRGLSWRTGS